jgi:hypothetical protein
MIVSTKLIAQAVAVSLTKCQTDKLDQIPSYRRGMFVEFEAHHIDQIWEHMCRYEPEFHEFALTLRHDDDPRIDRGVARLQNGSLHEYRYQQDEGVTFDTLMLPPEKSSDMSRQIHLQVAPS